MEKINIAELLKDCPKGMELDCTIYENVQFDIVQDGNAFPIKINTPEGRISLSKYGCCSLNSQCKCTIFPKGKTTWEGFQRPFKDGDVVALDTARGVQVFIFKEYIDTKTDYACCHVMLDDDGAIDFQCGNYYVERFATEEEKERLFKAIKDNGYKWNEETKILEKLIVPKFKVGDRIKKKKDYISGIVTNISDDDSYKVEYQEGGVSYASLAYQDDWELVPNKFDTTTLIPFESRMLARNDEDDKWVPVVWGFYDKDEEWPYNCSGFYYAQCIPYEGNEHLLGKTDDCENFYKTWE